MQGAKFGSTTVELDYINVPVMVKYMFDNGFRMQAGPQLGFLINAKARNNGTTNIGDSYKPIDMSVGFGLGYINPATSLGFDIRYNAGLSDISETNLVETKNRGFQVGIFYLFDHR
jgi:hypothetical protein